MTETNWCEKDLPKFDEDTISMFWNFVTERQEAWHNRTRMRSARPWSSNGILQDYSFTNTYRLFDPGTQYLLQNVLMEEASAAARLFNTLLYRCVGRESTMRELGMLAPDANSGDPTCQSITDQINDVFRTIKARGEPPFSKAYTVPGYEWTGGVDKIDNFAIQAGRWAKDWDKTFDRLASVSSPQEFYDILRELQGIGNFIASQVYVDCTYYVDRRENTLLGWPSDFYSGWMQCGPGALDGLWRLTGKKATMAEIQSCNLELLRELYDGQLPELESREFKWATLGELYPAIRYGDDVVSSTRMCLSITDVQNCLCEFGKYHKLFMQEGTKSRRKYQPREYTPSEWSDNEFVARLALSPRLEMRKRLSRSGENGHWCCVHMGQYDITEWISRYSGYPVEYVVKGIPAIFVADLDPVKYPLESGNSSPSTELTYHFLCGLRADIPVEIVESTAA